MLLDVAAKALRQARLEILCVSFGLQNDSPNRRSFYLIVGFV